MSTEEHTAQLQRLADEVLTGHNLAALDEIFHADYIEDEPPPGMGPGRDGLRQWLADWITAFPDVRWTVEEQIADEDSVWSRSTWQGTHQGSFLGIPPTGKHVTVAAWTIDRFTDGKIAEPDHHGHTRDDAATWRHPCTRSAAALIKPASSQQWMRRSALQAPTVSLQGRFTRGGQLLLSW